MSEVDTKTTVDAVAAAPDTGVDTTADVTVSAPDTAAEPTEAKTSEVAPSSDDEAEAQLKVVRQLEFYFADSNLPYDKFMWQLHTANDEHWVPLKTVTSFKRMREHLVDRELSWVADAIRVRSSALEVDEKGDNVRRTTEVTEPKGQFQRSVYAKGFGEEEPGLQAKLENFFNQYGRCNAVRMRRDESKLFKGSVFAEFADFSSVKKFLDLDPKPEWEGTPLITMSKEDYCEMKIKEKGLTGAKAQARRDTMAEGVGRRGFNAFREMANKGKSGEAREKPEVYLDFLGNRVRVYEGEDGRGTIKEEDVTIVNGVTLKFEGCGGDCLFEQVKGPLKERFARAPHIGYKRGDDHGYVGFDKPLTEEEVTFVKDTVKQINGRDVAWHHATEEEERAQQLDRARFAASRALSSSTPSSARGGRGGRGGSRGGRGGSGRGGRGGGKRGGSGDKRGEKKESGAAASESADGETGAKRKRGVEPDGGLHVGERNAGVPTLVSAAKKQKTEA